jgi:hypothetical protein
MSVGGDRLIREPTAPDEIVARAIGSTSSRHIYLHQDVRWGGQKLRRDSAMVSRGIQATALAVLLAVGSLGAAMAQVRGGAAGTLQGNPAGTLRGNLAGTLHGNPAGMLRGNPAGTLGGNSAGTMNGASPGGTAGTLQSPNSNGVDSPPNGQ